MTSFHIVADEAGTARTRDWLARNLGQVEVSSHRPGAAPDALGAGDIVVVAGAGKEDAVAALLAAEMPNIFDGDILAARAGPAARFIDLARRAHVGAAEPAVEGRPLQPGGRDGKMFLPSARPIMAGHAPAGATFVVNSIPKSGTLWMAAMLEDLLGVETGRQITVSHAGDLELDAAKPNVLGILALARDLRDVVVSWFHQAGRDDMRSGMSSPRYGDIESFYFQSVLGTLRLSRRFYGGDIERWLDSLGTRGIPILRYEDLRRDPATSLHRVSALWNVKAESSMLTGIAEAHSFDRIGETLATRATGLAGHFAEGHARRGEVGAWHDELPDAVAEDISTRFRGYQERLGYLPRKGQVAGFDIIDAA